MMGDGMMCGDGTLGPRACRPRRHGVTFTSGMPGFSSVLDAQEIGAILDYIKSTWPDHIRDLQAQRSSAVVVD